MKTLLRKIPDKRYFQLPDQWTRDAREAYDFRSMSRAIEFVEEAGYRNIEVAFLREHSRRCSSVRVDTLEGLEM